MPDQVLVIRLDGEKENYGAQIERIEEEIEARGIGEVEATFSGMGEVVLFIELPEACTVVDLPARMVMLQKVLDDLGLDAKGTVAIPEDADDDDEEGWVTVGGEDAEDEEEDDEGEDGNDDEPES